MTEFKSVEAIHQGILIKSKIDDTFPVEMFFTKSLEVASSVIIKIGDIKIEEDTVFAASMKMALI